MWASRWFSQLGTASAYTFLGHLSRASTVIIQSPITVLEQSSVIDIGKVLCLEYN